MKIEILQLVEGARQARGLTVIIDVFRAFTTACYVFANGADKIMPVGDLDIVYQLKQQNPDYLMIGERHGIKIPDFDFGNSPTDIEHMDFSGRTLIQTTSAGTQGIANAVNAGEIITGSFVNAPAIVKYIRQIDPAQVSLVCMGRETIEPSDEDTLCAQYISDLLQERQTDFDAIRRHLRSYHSAAKFFDQEKSWAPERDFDLCMDVGRFNFVLQVSRDEEGNNYMQKLDI